VLVVVLILVIWPGAELGAPADPSVPYSAARPEWYFLFLFQFLKLPYFAGSNEVYGAVVIPSLVMLMLALMPFVGCWKLGHWFNIGFFAAILVGISVLTSMAMIEDHRKPEYQVAVKRARLEAERAVELAQSPTGIPATGAVALVRSDPLIQGPRLFAQSCASCHRYDGHDGTGLIPRADTDPQTASDLKGFASRDWVQGILDPAKVDSLHYFGATKHKDGKMVKFVKEDLVKADEFRKAGLKAAAIALSAEAQLKSQRELDAQDADLIKQGRSLIQGDAGCTDCHTFHDAKNDVAPDLTGYGSRQWLIDFINDPSHPRFYGEINDRMPPFGAKQLLDETQIELIVDWIRGEWKSPTTRPE
jgi:ubiquinol-cytochrome c reductase cytochrome b subunit